MASLPSGALTRVVSAATERIYKPISARMRFGCTAKARPVANGSGSLVAIHRLVGGAQGFFRIALHRQMRATHRESDPRPFTGGRLQPAAPGLDPGGDSRRLPVRND